MNYCFNCGSELGEGMNFCPDCGALLVQTAPEESFDDKKPSKYGVLLTNLAALAEKYSVPGREIARLLGDYIGKLERSSICYTLIDASDYLYRNPDVDKRVSLSPSDRWLSHADILSDHYRFGCTKKQRPGYLFIIGGGDVIPMPGVSHFVDDDDLPDKDIETDMPYSYLEGARTEQLLSSTELFKKDIVFHVGRLPLGADSSLKGLEGYLSRAAKAARKGVEVRRAYGQTDINWKEVSSRVSSPLSGLFPKRAMESGSDYCHKGLFTTPSVELSNVGRVFERDADLYFFNMHGSNARSTNYFLGQYEDGGPYVGGVSPSQIASASQDNIFVTEACYGAKFNGLAAGSSMLLSALGNRTLSYLGSSRIAWGMIDASLSQFSAARLNNADVICHAFIDALKDGVTAGEALYLSRKACFSVNSSLSPVQASSIVEFNLFGDPALFAAWKGGRKSGSGEQVVTTSLAPQDAKLGYSVEKVGDGSMLSGVRGLVDANIAHIRSALAVYTAENFGLGSDSLHNVSRIKYDSGQQQYAFMYNTRQGEIHKFYRIETDLQGNITSVLISK